MVNLLKPRAALQFCVKSCKHLCISRLIFFYFSLNNIIIIILLTDYIMKQCLHILINIAEITKSLKWNTSTSENVTLIIRYSVWFSLNFTTLKQKNIIFKTFVIFWYGLGWKVVNIDVPCMPNQVANQKSKPSAQVGGNVLFRLFLFWQLPLKGLKHYPKSMSGNALL